MIPAGGHLSAGVFGPCAGQAVRSYPSRAFTQGVFMQPCTTYHLSVGTHISADMAARCLSSIPSKEAGASTATTTKPEIWPSILSTRNWERSLQSSLKLQWSFEIKNLTTNENLRLPSEGTLNKNATTKNKRSFALIDVIWKNTAASCVHFQPRTLTEDAIIFALTHLRHRITCPKK